MNDLSSKLPVTFWIIAVVALTWNIMGVLTFFGQTFMSEETLATYPEEQQALFLAVPSWLTIVYAIAVLTGTLGCIALLLRKGLSVPLFLVSLVGVIIQMAYNQFFTDAPSVFGVISVVMSGLIVLIAVFLYYYARQCQAKGWIS